MRTRVRSPDRLNGSIPARGDLRDPGTPPTSIATSAEQFLRDRLDVIILVEMGLRPYKELMPIEKRQIDLENRLVHVADSKTPNGVADMPMTDPAYEAFREQIEDTAGSDYLFPTTRRGSSKPYIGSLKKVWASTLKRAQVQYFTLYELRHTFATRLSAGGVAEEWVTQLLRQGDAKVFKKYSQMKLEMMLEALNRLNRRANEGQRASAIPAPS